MLRRGHGGKLLISILTPVWNPEPKVLDAAIASVAKQTYPSWQLCLVDDGSTRPGVEAVLQRWTERDRRIEVLAREENGGISAASNDALAFARGHYVALLDHDDRLSRNALSEVVRVLTQFPDTDVLYTDETKLDESGRLTEPWHKPGWSPEYLEGCMYLGHLSVYRRSLMNAVGGFRVGLEGSQDWDLALRATERATSVRHLPKVLYQWRRSADSVAAAVDAKPYAVDAGKRAVSDHLERTGVDGYVQDSGHLGWFHVRRNLPDAPLVSIIIPTIGSLDPDLGGRFVHECLRSLVESQDYPHWEVICMIGEQAAPELEAELQAIAGDRLRTFRTTGPFNFSATINAGAVRSRGQRLLLLNDDTAGVAGDWLRRLVEAVEDPEVGIAGAKLVYPDGSVQHAGVVHTRAGAPWHPHAGFEDGVGYLGDLLLTMNYLAVTGACQMVRREVFEELGGLDEALPINYNDIDFCLKAVQRGYRNVQVNGAVLTHHESVTRPPTVTYQEMNHFVATWGEVARTDPFTRPQIHIHA